MKMRMFSGLAASLLLLILGFSGAVARGAANFAITATSVTMPRTGNGQSQYTVTGIPAAGWLVINCVSAGPIDPTVTSPDCFTGLPMQLLVQPGQTVTGTVEFLPPGTAVPGTVAAGLLLPGAILLGLGLRRRTKLLRLAALALIGLAGTGSLTSCAGNGFNGMTPGTYQYTVSAVFSPTVTGPPTSLATTTVLVTVP